MFLQNFVAFIASVIPNRYVAKPVDRFYPYEDWHVIDRYNNEVADCTLRTGNKETMELYAFMRNRLWWLKLKDFENVPDLP